MRKDDPGRITSELAISGAWPLPRNYPTREQAAAAATHELSDVGDTVYVHEASCSLQDSPECDCRPVVIELTTKGWRYHESLP